MPPQTRTFSVNFVSAVLASIPISGYANGDAITMAYSNDDFEWSGGSDGYGIWIQKHNTNVDVTVRLAQGNPGIALIRQLHAASLALGGKLYPFQYVNLKSTDEIVAGQAMIKKHPDIKAADSESPAEIMLGVSAVTFAGGTIIPG